MDYLTKCAAITESTDAKFSPLLLKGLVNFLLLVSLD